MSKTLMLGITIWTDDSSDYQSIISDLMLKQLVHPNHITFYTESEEVENESELQTSSEQNAVSGNPQKPIFTDGYTRELSEKLQNAIALRTNSHGSMPDDKKD